MFRVEPVHLPANHHMGLQHRLQGAECRRPPRPPTRRKRPQIIRGGSQHVGLIHRDKPPGRSHPFLGKPPVESGQHPSHITGKHLGSSLLQPWIQPQPTRGGEMLQGEQRLQLPVSQGSNHLRVPVERRSIELLLHPLGLQTGPLDPEAVGRQSHHFRPVKVLLIPIPEIDRPAGPLHPAGGFPFVPIIAGLPLPVVATLMLVGAGSHAPKKFSVHRFRTLSAITSCCSASTRIASCSGSDKRVCTTVSAALGRPILRAAVCMRFSLSGSARRRSTL